MFTILGGDGKEYGPASAEQIRGWIKAGRANLETKAKAVSTEEWKRIGEFAEFAAPSDLPPVMTAAAAPASTGSVSAPSENVPATAVPANRGARTAGALINAMFYLFCIIPGSFAGRAKLLERFPDMAQGTMPPFEELLDPGLMSEITFWARVGFGIGILLQIALLSARGQNLGKWIVGVRVVRADDGQPAGFLRGTVLRFLLPVAVLLALNSLSLFTALLACVLLLVDYFLMFRDDQRCLHDQIAGTKVVKV